MTSRSRAGPGCTWSATSPTSPGRTARPSRSSARSPSRAAPGRPGTSWPRLRGEPGKSFHYKDKGIMAMIGRGAAVAEVGKHRHELHGSIAFAAWLGVHAALMSGVRNRIEAFVDWGWDYFSDSRGPQILDRRSEAAHIDWGDADDAEVKASPGRAGVVAHWGRKPWASSARRPERPRTRWTRTRARRCAAGPTADAVTPQPGRGRRRRTPWPGCDRRRWSWPGCPRRTRGRPWRCQPRPR